MAAIAHEIPLGFYMPEKPPSAWSMWYRFVRAMVYSAGNCFFIIGVHTLVPMTTPEPRIANWPFLAPVACYMFFQSWAVVLQNIGCGLAMFYPPWVMALLGSIPMTLWGLGCLLVFESQGMFPTVWFIVAALMCIPVASFSTWFLSAPASRTRQIMMNVFWANVTMNCIICPPLIAALVFMGLMDVTRDDAHTQLAVIVGYNFFMAVARTRYLPLRMYGNESRDLLYRARYCVEMAHKLSSKLIFVQISSPWLFAVSKLLELSPVAIRMAQDHFEWYPGNAKAITQDPSFSDHQISLAKAKATAAAAKAEAKAAKDGGGSASPRPAGGLPPVLDDAAAAVSPASAGAVALAVGRSSAGTSESAQLDATILTLNRRYDRLITLLSSFMTLLTSNVFFMLILPLSRFGPNKDYLPYDETKLAATDFERSLIYTGISMCVDIIVLILSVLWYSRGPRQERPPYQVDPSAPMAPIRLNPARGGWGMNPLEVAGDLGGRACHVAPGMVAHFLFWVMLTHFGIRGPIMELRPGSRAS